VVLDVDETVLDSGVVVRIVDRVEVAVVVVVDDTVDDEAKISHIKLLFLL